MSSPARPFKGQGDVCCGNNPPVPLYTIGLMFPSQGAAMRAAYIAQGVNPDQPWCRECSTALEQVRDGLAQGGPLFISMVASIASFVPGIGTAVSAVLESGLALAQGKDITDAFVAGLKAALPGGPMAEMAFNAGQAALEGKDIEGIAIDSLPISDDAKALIATGLKIAQSIAEGEPASKILLDTAYDQLPEYGQRAVDLAEALHDGRSLEEIVVEQTQHDLPDYLRVGILAGMTVGYAKSLQGGLPPIALGRVEAGATKARNDDLARRGRAVAAATPVIDAARMVKTSYPQGVTNADWRRGFDIATIVAKDCYVNGPGQNAILASIGTPSGRTGFSAGRELQYHLTRVYAAIWSTSETKADTTAAIYNYANPSLTKGVPMSIALGRGLSSARVAQLNALIDKGGQLSATNPVFRATRAGNTAFLKGYDCAIAVCAGTSIPGPGQSAARWDTAQMVVTENLGSAADAHAGFDLGQALQHGISKTGGGQAVISPDPNVAAGQLAVHGISGSTISPDQKAAVVGNAIAGNPGARAGASAVIAEKKSLWQTFLAFFGL